MGLPVNIFDFVSFNQKKRIGWPDNFAVCLKPKVSFLSSFLRHLWSSSRLKIIEKFSYGYIS